MAIAFAGIVVMFGGGIDAGQLTGNLLALGVSVCFAAQLTVLRKFHATRRHAADGDDRRPVVAGAGLRAGGPFTATAQDLRDARAHGLRAARHRLPARRPPRRARCPATELGLLALLEPILGPLWVWVLMGERPGPSALAGGALVLCAVIANQALAAWRGRDAEARAPLPGP